MKEKRYNLPVRVVLAVAAVSASATAAQIDVVGTLAPVNTTTGSGVRGVHALTASQTWTKNNEYFLTDRVFIPNGVTLTIEPGTKIYGSTNDMGTPGVRADDKVGSLIAARGGRLVAEGTREEPIVFTTIREWEVANNQDSPFDPDDVIGPAPAPGQAGLWGGIVLLGNAYICHLDGTTGTNLGKAAIEGFVPASSPSDDGDGIPDAIQYGFDTGYPRDDEDDSGVLRYVSICYGGYEFEAGKEINGLTLGGVGNGTVIDHVEIYANTDDGVEFFGGTVSTSHMVLSNIQDDNFDFDSGHAGKHQFLFSVANPGLADGGFESDGIEGTTATQAAYDAAFDNPSAAASQRTVKAGITLSKPVIYNATIVGPGRTNTTSTIAVGTGQVLTEKGNHAFIFDDYFNGEVYNSVFDDFAQDLAFFRDNDKSTGPTARMANNTIGRFGGGTPGNNNTYITNANALNLFFNSLTGTPQDGNSDADTDPKFTAYTRDASNFLTTIDPRPAGDSPLWKSNGATLRSGAPVPVTYRGAFGAFNWAAGWTRLSQSGVLQGPAEGGTGGGEPPFLDTDGDGISDELENSAALQALGFSATVNNTGGTNLFASLYTETSIQTLRGTGVLVQRSGNNVTLELPVWKSNELNGDWEAAGVLSTTIEGVPEDKQFYRLQVDGLE